MPGFLLHEGAIVLCGHGGQAAPTAPQPRVTVSGQRVATLLPPYRVTGCPINSPCVSAQWVVGAARVSSLGQPLVVTSGVGICAPTGSLLAPKVQQSRVVAT